MTFQDIQHQNIFDFCDICTYGFFGTLNTNLRSKLQNSNGGPNMELQNNQKAQKIFDCYDTWHLEVFLGC